MRLPAFCLLGLVAHALAACTEGNGSGECATGKCISIGNDRYCSQCAYSGEYPVNGTCVASNSACGAHGNGVCTECNKDYFLYEGGCYSTAAAPGNLICRKATDSGNCKRSSKGYYAVEDVEASVQTVFKCNDTTSRSFKIDKKTITVSGIAHCLQCTDADDDDPVECAQCAGDYYISFDGRSCVPKSGCTGDSIVAVDTPVKRCTCDASRGLERDEVDDDDDNSGEGGYICVCSDSYYRSGDSCVPCWQNSGSIKALSTCGECEVKKGKYECEECKVGYYSHGDEDIRTCYKCDQDSTYNKKTIKGVTGCGKCEYDDDDNKLECKVCGSGYVTTPTSKTKCTPCNDPNCDQCSDSAVGKCLACKKNYYLYPDGTCKDTCQSGGMKAVKAGLLLWDNSPATSCTCDTGYFLSGTTCTSCSVDNCQTCTEVGTCTVCQAGYYKNGNQCSACHSSCAECAAGGETGCTRCPQKYILNITSSGSTDTDPISGKCTPECDASQISINCVACDLAVNNTKYCTECVDGYAPLNGVCIEASPSSPTTRNTATGCVPDSAGVCKECTDGLFWYNGGCYPLKTYPGNTICKVAEPNGNCTTCVIGSPTPDPNCTTTSCFNVCPVCPVTCTSCIPSPGGIVACEACVSGKPVNENGTCTSMSGSDGLSPGAIAGIVIAVLVVVGGLTGFLVWWFVCRK